MRKSLVFAAGLCLLVLGLASSAVAQQPLMGLYYNEVEKDGRVYAFNTPETFKAWSAGGEMGKSVTLVGRAVDGKTLVAENETAVDLYLFKHNLPGYERPTPPPYNPGFDVSWKDGKTTFKTKTAEIAISNRLQARYTMFNVDNPAVEDIGTFNIRRAKTAIEGKAGDWKFKLQANWVGGGYVTAASIVSNSLRTTVRRGPELEDAEIWWTKNPMATVWVGQGKVPFGRQEYTSSQAAVRRPLDRQCALRSRPRPGHPPRGHEQLEDLRVRDRRLQRHRAQHQHQRQ
jgi:hypothetical protein